jgi:hypothetical protein
VIKGRGHPTKKAAMVVIDLFEGFGGAHRRLSGFELRFVEGAPGAPGVLRQGRRSLPVSVAVNRHDYASRKVDLIGQKPSSVSGAVLG